MSVIISAGSATNEIRQILEDGRYPRGQIYTLANFGPQMDDGQYFNPDFMTYGNQEVFIDAGCYDLETSLKLKKYCNQVKKIYAFEPDPDNYMICEKKRTQYAYEEVELLPYGTWSGKGTLHFGQGGSGSSVNENGTIEVSVVPIDAVVDPADRITMIKMDVEGAELESLKGARKTIQRDKPKLAICIYHKPEDMTEIPLYIKELVPEYKLYVRHHSNTDNETVLYAVVP